MLSAVIPVYNEKESLSAFYTVLIKNIAKVQKDYEIVFVDDGSSDKSLKILKEFESKNNRVKV